MQRIADVMAKEKAQLWINHDMAQRNIAQIGSRSSTIDL